MELRSGSEAVIPIPGATGPGEESRVEWSGAASTKPGVILSGAVFQAKRRISREIDMFQSMI